MNKALNLYAKIEPLLNFYEDYERLYQKYLEIINKISPASILDFGCGNGRLLQLLSQKGFNAFGIDLSAKMIDMAKTKNINAECIDIKDLGKNFDLIVAAADVLNYFDPVYLQDILEAISSKLMPKGYFVADINTLFGFENVAEGTLIIDKKELFLSVEANFNDEKLVTNFTLFEKENELFRKESQTITQHFHALKFFKKLKDFTLLQTFPFCLFGEKPDKTIMIFQKVY